MTAPSTSGQATPRREWTPRMWQGCDVLAWWRVLIRNRFAVHLKYLYIAVVISCVSTFWYGSRIDRTPIREAPVFIVGHWRTGTTLLHELLILDDRHNFPNTFECLCPHHFLWTER